MGPTKNQVFRTKRDPYVITVDTILAIQKDIVERAGEPWVFSWFIDISGAKYINLGWQDTYTSFPNINLQERTKSSFSVDSYQLLQSYQTLNSSHDAKKMRGMSQSQCYPCLWQYTLFLHVRHTTYVKLPFQFLGEA